MTRRSARRLRTTVVTWARGAALVCVLMSTPRAFAQADPPSPMEPAPTALRSVRLFVHTRGYKSPVRVELGGAEVEPRLICESVRTDADGARRPSTRPWAPCIVDVPAQSELRMFAGDASEAQTLVVPDDRGDDLDIELVVPKKRAKPSDVGFRARLHGGMGQRSFFGASLRTAEGTFSLGGYIDDVDVYVDLQVLLSSVRDLSIQQYRVGPSVDVEVFRRMRLGGGLSLGGISMARATTSTPMSAFNWGARVFASFDVVRYGDRGGLYVLGQLSVDSVGSFLASKRSGDADSPSMWGPTVALGARF